MYCDDSRVTQVDAKEVVVSLPYDLSPLHKLTPLAPLGQARLHLILQESQNLNYTFIFLFIFPSFFASLPLNTSFPVIVLCIIQPLQPYRLYVTTEETGHGKWMCINNIFPHPPLVLLSLPLSPSNRIRITQVYAVALATSAVLVPFMCFPGSLLS